MKFLTLAFILEAIIIRYVPEQLIVEYLGSQSTYGILLSSLVGVPLYTSGIATLPLVEGMISQGMSGAAALTFLISGPTTTIPALAAVYGIAKRKVFILYLAFSLIGSVFFGYAFHILN